MWRMKAFPTTKPLDSWDDPNQGMDLRDYFAAKALQLYVERGDFDIKDVAHSCYVYADAMMEARKQ